LRRWSALRRRDTPVSVRGRWEHYVDTIEGNNVGCARELALDSVGCRADSACSGHRDAGGAVEPVGVRRDLDGAAGSRRGAIQRSGRILQVRVLQRSLQEARKK